MTIEVGGVVITADIDLENQLTKSQKIDKTIDDVGKSSLKAEKGFKSLETVMVHSLATF